MLMRLLTESPAQLCSYHCEVRTGGRDWAAEEIWAPLGTQRRHRTPSVMIQKINLSKDTAD